MDDNQIEPPSLDTMTAPAAPGIASNSFEVTDQVFEDEPSLLALLQLSCVDEELLENLISVYAAFGRSEITKAKYQEEISRLCPSPMVFLWNRLVRSILFEDYKNEIGEGAVADESANTMSDGCANDDNNSNHNGNNGTGEHPLSNSDLSEEDEDEDEDEDEEDEEDEDSQGSDKTSLQEDQDSVVTPTTNNTQRIVDEAEKLKQRIGKKKPFGMTMNPQMASAVDHFKIVRPNSGNNNNSNSTTGKKNQKSKSDSSSRTRSEWTPQEDRLFLEGLKRHGLNFREICKIIPNRTRSQIRTHYRYLARSLRENFANGQSESGGPYRRIKTRGRPPRGKPLPTPSSLMLELKETIEQIENSSLFMFKSKIESLP
eukprot:TRINITY_DN2180_c0_g1_i1.p1 TRINITY_DN2180_c0_g1~~TRINITY_DN2180_c0_g1_i1.p1  ORF type:complete len:372 (+),score=95.07 TRINITY_DN2180_c0_g1_i1:201-1316(+)